MNGYRIFRLLVSIVLCVGIGSGCGKERDARSEAGPDLDKVSYARLLELASAEGGSRQFDAILKLRERGDGRAVPVLKTVLEKNIGTGKTFGYAAAQALFCIGTPRAHEILQRHLLTSAYSAMQGIRYAFHWDMPRESRDRFISRYHLVSTSKELDVKQTARSLEGEGQKFNFRIVLTNRTDRSIRIYDPQVYLGKMLVISDSEGHFVRMISNVQYEMPLNADMFPELPPGGEYEFEIAAEPRWIDTGAWKGMGLTQPLAMVLDCGDVQHVLGGPGKITVYALYSVDKRVEGQAKRLGLSPGWAGRVVSEPVTLDIAPVPRKTGQ